MQGKIILFVFLFLNMYFPISPFFVMGANIIFFFVCGKPNITKINRYILGISFVLMIIVTLAAAIFSMTDNTTIIFKYVRIFVSTYLLISITNRIKVRTDLFVRVFAFTLLLHSFVIILQIAYPPLSQIIAPIFNFNRDSDLLKYMLVRKLGLTGGFDASSFVLVMSEILFFYIYYKDKNPVYIFLSIISLVLTLFTSRLGLLIGLVVFLFFSYILFKSKTKKNKILGIVVISAGLLFAVKVMLPIFASTNIIDTAGGSSSDISFFTQDYSTKNGTVDALTGSQIKVYNNLTFLEAFFGKAEDVNSDIGYIQIIFQVGWIGLILIVFLHFCMLQNVLRMKPISTDADIIRKFIILYIIVLFIFNYKVLLMFSRAYYDILVILVCYLNHVQTKSIDNYEA